VTSKIGKNVKFTAVTGTWTVPVAHCTPADAGASSTAWVGIGGFQEKYQDEVGTNSNCDKNGKPHYFAWFELVPYPAYLTFDKDHWSIKWGVKPGDVMTGTVKILSRKKIRLELHNRTQKWLFTRDVDLALQDTTTAEWVVSAPANCISFDCAQASLSNFDKVRMRNVSATGNGKTGTLKNPNWRVLQVKLVPGKLIVPYLGIDNNVTRTGQAVSPAGATPGPPSADGKSFEIKWVRVAKRGL
jgi:Peptidase A4 family